MNITSIIEFFRLRIFGQSTKRFEILLPLNYNDGSLIEPEKLEQTLEELTNQFNGLTTDPVAKSGRWKYKGVLYLNASIQVTIDTKDRNAILFMRKYKTLLKERFRQLDIWISVQEIEIL